MKEVEENKKKAEEKEFDEDRYDKLVDRYKSLGDPLYYIERDFDTASVEEKKELFQNYIKELRWHGHTDFQDKQQLGKVEEFIETDTYKKLEDMVLGSGLTSENFFNYKGFQEPLSDLFRFVSKPDVNVFDVEKTTIKKTNETIKSLQGFCKNTGIAVIEPKKQYENALDSFNTKRASMFSQESSLHKSVREAATGIQEFRKGLGDKTPKQALQNKDLPQEEQVKIAKEWLRKAHELRDAAADYVTAKDGAFTPAGRERLRAAKNLKAMGKAEIDACRSAIIKAGGRELLDKVYAEIRKDKVNEAKATLEEMKDIKKPNEADQLKIWDAVHTIVAGSVTEKAEQANKLKCEEYNVFRVTRHNKHTFVINSAVAGIVQGYEFSEIQKMKTEEMVQEVQNTVENSRFGKDVKLEATEKREKIRTKEEQKKINAAKPKGFSK